MVETKAGVSPAHLPDSWSQLSPSWGKRLLTKISLSPPARLCNRQALLTIF